ncbi:MAG: polyprenyl synthetase family protein [Victivallales bacterium]|nr:polyprenyl synthetase family protein [Victivallales bacterium]
MKSTINQTVPPEPTIRRQIRATARDWVNRNDVPPPQTRDCLRTHAQRLLTESGLDYAFMNYTMIMLNNALWENGIVHIPKEERLLLLPVCLRNHQACQATGDELGLLCRGCGNCPIPELTEKAEKAGLNVLVAESSSRVGEWIDTGEIRAIIGVSCLHSLEKAFPSMLRHAVPGIAIPLLADGCKNTTFDLSFLDDALAIGEDPYRYVNPDTAIRTHLKRLFSVETVKRYLNASTPYLKNFPELVYGALCDNGKHYRPMITFGTFCSLRNRADFPDFMNPIALAVECFHKASLIHDDIEDEDDWRYDKPTLHKQAGNSVALNVGDFLIGEGYRLLSHDAIPAEIRAELHVQAAQAHCELSLGQAQEFESLANSITLEQCLETHRLKTAPAFRVAMNMAAIATGEFDRYREIFNAFANYLGVAYQLMDDLEDIHDNPASAVDSLMRGKGLNREAARAEIFELYHEYKQKTYAALEAVADPVLKIFLYRLSGRVLKDA